MSTAADIVRAKKVKPQFRETFDAAIALIRAQETGLDESVKWGHLWLHRGSENLIALAQLSGSHLNLQFANGAHLVDLERVLEGTGKDMRHIKLKTPAQVRDLAPVISALVKQSVELGQTMVR